ncbi:MAG: glycosyltransferase 61 family protein [Geitlerinemataceae cyanobacterium]|mgnify:CR=1 FL=1
MSASPIGSSAHHKEAERLIDAGKIEAAIVKLCESTLLAGRSDLFDYSLLATCFVRLGRVEAALEAARRAVELSIPNNCSQWFYDLHVEMVTRLPAAAIEQAVTYYGRWLDIRIDNRSDERLRHTIAACGLSMLAVLRADSERAGQMSLMGLKLVTIADRPTDVTYYRFPLAGIFDRVGQHYLVTQQYRLGADYYRGAIEIQPDNAAFYRNLAMMLSEAGDRARGLDCTVRACELDASIYSEMQLESIEFRLRQVKHARYADFAEAVLAQRPNQATIALIYGRLCLQAGRAERGIRALQRAIATFYAEAVGDRAFIRAYIERTAQLAPDAVNGDADRRMARWLETLRSTPKSRECYRKFVDIQLHQQETDADRTREQMLGMTRAIPKAIGWYDSTADYVRAASLGGQRYIAIDDERHVRLKAPRTLPGLEADLFAPREFDSTPLFVAELIGARLCWGGAIPVAGKNVVATITHDRHLLADVSVRMPYPTVGFDYPHPRQHWLLNQERTPPLQHHPGAVANLASIAGRDGTANYYHWIVDLLPRVTMLRDSGFDLDAIDLFLVDNYRSQFQRDSLAALGVPLDRVASISDYPHLQAERTILPSLPGKLATLSHYSARVLRRTLGRQFGAPEGTAPTQRLYIRRDRARYRRIFNETELVTRLEHHGFVPVRPEELSFGEQVRLFSEAEAIVAPHGAGLTNAIFCSPGTRIVELLAPGYIVPYYWILASQCDLDYYYLTGEGMHGSHLRKLIYPNRIEEDVFIDLDRLEALLELAGLTHS